MHLFAFIPVKFVFPLAYSYLCLQYETNIYLINKFSVRVHVDGTASIGV